MMSLIVTLDLVIAVPGRTFLSLNLLKSHDADTGMLWCLSKVGKLAVIVLMLPIELYWSIVVIEYRWPSLLCFLFKTI